METIFEGASDVGIKVLDDLIHEFPRIEYRIKAFTVTYPWVYYIYVRNSDYTHKLHRFAHERFKEHTKRKRENN